jgi:hypothetical protein
MTRPDMVRRGRQTMLAHVLQGLTPSSDLVKHGGFYVQNLT